MSSQRKSCSSCGHSMASATPVENKKFSKPEPVDKPCRPEPAPFKRVAFDEVVRVIPDPPKGLKKFVLSKTFDKYFLCRYHDTDSD